MPGFVPAAQTIFKLQWLRLVRGNRMKVGAGAALLVVVALVIIRYAQDVVEPADIVAQGVRLGFFTLLVYLIPFLLCSGTISEEVEARTLPFLIARPISRLSLVLGKYLAGVLGALAILMGGLLVLHVASYVSEPTLLVDQFGTTAKFAGGIALLVFYYGAVCIFWGALAPEASGIVSGLFLAVLEFGCGVLPGPFRLVSMNYHAGELAGVTRGGLMADSVPEVPFWVSLGLIPLLAIIFLLLGQLTLRTTEYRFGKA